MKLEMKQLLVLRGAPEILAPPDNPHDEFSWSIAHEAIENARRYGVVQIILGYSWPMTTAQGQKSQEVLRSKLEQLAYPGEEIIVRAVHAEALPNNGGWLMLVYSRPRIPDPPVPEAEE